MQIFREHDRFLEIAIDLAKKHDPTLEPDQYVEFDDNGDHGADKRMTDEEFELTCSKLNSGQKELSDYVTQSIVRQDEGSSERIRLFVTGGAGTGKTFTLNQLKEQIRRCCKGNHNSVKVAAPTGVAASLVNGRTLHNMFKFEVQKDGVIKSLKKLTGKW
jgi:hypothetical protein